MGDEWDTSRVEASSLPAEASRDIGIYPSIAFLDR